MLKISSCFFRNLLLTGVFLLCGLAAKASHIVGMDLSYQWISGNTYKITLVAYGDCGSAAAFTPTSSAPYYTLFSATPRICIYDGNTSVGNLTLNIIPDSTREITPVCPADTANTQCHNLSSTIPGIKKFVYTGTYTLPHTSTHWRFLFLGYMGAGVSPAGRATSITNIITTPNTVTELVDTLNNSFRNNTSPDLTIVPTPYFCLGAADNYNSGAVDPDGDSLSFFLVSGEGTSSGGTSSCTPSGAVTYVAPYTGSAPLGTVPGSFVFDQLTGQVSFTPNILQRALVCYNIEEYHHDTLMGTSQREMTFLVLTCTNTAPKGGLTTATNGTVDDSTHFHICLNNGPFSVNANATETDTTNQITMSATGLPAGSSFTVANNGTNHPLATFSWTSTGVTPGFYTFYVNYTDNNCPLSGSQTLAFTVEILPIPTVSYTIISPATCAAPAVISVAPGGLGTPWTVVVHSPTGTTLDSVLTPTNVLDTLVPGHDTFIVYSSLSSFCNTVLPFTIAPATFVSPTATFTNPTYCGNNDGTITLSSLDANELDTIKYTYNGVVQPPVVVFTSDTGTTTLTDLCAGPYTNITVSWGHCTTTPIGPLVLDNPAFTMNYIELVQNPTKCGFNDGIIKIHGLHPGQTDTLRYSLGGVPQTPVVTYVGLDSIITISGLGAGTYTSFIANTQGACPNSPAGCTSNVLGPVTLVAPPISPAFTDIVHLGCKQDTVYFTNGSTPASDLTYHWYYGDGTTDTATNPTHIYYPPGPVTYTVTLVITNTHCVDSVKETVNFTNIVHASFTENPTVAVCQGSTITFSNASTGIGNSYVWNFGNGTTSTSTSATLSEVYNNTGVYTVTLVATDYIPCRDTVQQLVYVDSNTAISILASDTVLCRGGQVTFTGLYTNIGLTNVVWDFGDGSSLLNVNPAVHSFNTVGDLTVTLTATYRSCPTATVTRPMRIYPYPNIYLGPDTAICPGGDAIPLQDNINAGNPLASWVWSDGTTGSGIMVTSAGYYMATVSIYGCETSDTVWVQNDCYVEYPNVFTPNGDGVNDYFFPRQLLSRGLTSFKMDIYNRWGQLIYETTSTDGRGWDGRFNGVDQPEGAFIYMIDATFKDGQKEHRNGNVTLIR